jgi:hypothetical protein
MSANHEELGSLHKLLAVLLREELERGEKTPALLEVVRKFLKDNGIESLAVKGSHLEELLAQMPTYEEIKIKDIQ